VDNSSAVFKNFDLSGADSIKIDAIVYNLNYGWNSMQIYTNGDAWAQASYGGSETSSDVKLDATGEFTATVTLTPDSDGYFEIGFGYTSADAFTILSLDFYKGAELLGSLVGNTFYPNATLELSASSTTLKVGEVYTITTTNASTTPVKFTSDDTTVASVNANGVVTALGVGTANIKVTDAFDNVSVIKVKVEAIIPTGITLAAVSTDVKGGDIVNLTATVTPDNATDKTVLWSSSDTAVATVDLNGKVTFANVSGTKTVTITAAAKADASVKATVTFTVEELVIENPVTGVTISDETLVLTKGETADLTATVTPEDATLKTVTWESADETIATVDSDGKVTATGIGTTTVTVKTVDGAKTASCEVTVNAPKATAVSVSVDGEEIDKLDMTVGDTVSLTATAEPDDAVQSFTFATSDESVVTVDEEGVLTAVAAGTATITVTADDVSTEIEVTVTVKKDGSLDVDATGEFKPTIDMSNEEVVSAIKNVLSEEQLAAIEDGTAKVEITLDVTNIDATVSQADKDLIAEAIESISGDYIVMNYLDIKFGANVDGEVISIFETDGLITVSVALDKAANGTYKVVRIHDGKADVIDSELSADGTRLTFRTDKFSTYAIIFADVASGDSTPSALIALLVLAAAAVIVTVSVSVKRTTKQR
ncbi:MAG: Ig domain-containing protein, partial [Butyrivibrio sp.]|nr:Ig domain-containing protein [Butyrivibrio sp.]